jgi:hypothetical protein
MNGYRLVHFHDVRETNDPCDRNNVAHEIEVELGEERNVGRVRGCGHQQRVAVGRGTHD